MSNWFDFWLKFSQMNPEGELLDKAYTSTRSRLTRDCWINRSGLTCYEKQMNFGNTCIQYIQTLERAMEEKSEEIC